MQTSTHTCATISSLLFYSDTWSLYLLVGVLLLQHDRQPLQESPHAGCHVKANHTLLLQCRAACGQHVVGCHKLLGAVHDQHILDRKWMTEWINSGAKKLLTAWGWGALPLTCWSRQPRPHLGSRQCSGSPLNRLQQSGAPSHPDRKRKGWVYNESLVLSNHTIYDAFHACDTLSVLTRSDQMFIRPPTPPDARARPSGLKASVLTGVMWPFSWRTHTAPSPNHWEDWRNFNTSRSHGADDRPHFLLICNKSLCTKSLEFRIFKMKRFRVINLL